MRHQVIFPFVLAASLAACSREPAPSPPAISSEELRNKIELHKLQSREHCYMTQKAALAILAKGDRLDIELTDKTTKSYWAYDVKSSQNRAMIAVGEHFFAFPHDSIDKPFANAATILYYELPNLNQLLSLYCDAEKKNKTFSSPSRIEVLIKSPGPMKDKISWHSSRERIWHASQFWSGKIIYQELGLESKTRALDPIAKKDLFLWKAS